MLRSVVHSMKAAMGAPVSRSVTRHRAVHVSRPVTTFIGSVACDTRHGGAAGSPISTVAPRSDTSTSLKPVFVEITARVTR